MPLPEGPDLRLARLRRAVAEAISDLEPLTQPRPSGPSPDVEAAIQTKLRRALDHDDRQRTLAERRADS